MMLWARLKRTAALSSQYLIFGMSLAFFCYAFVYVFEKVVTINKLAGYGDMAIFTEAARNFLSGNNIYFRSDNVAEYYAPGTAVFKFPPGFQLTLIPIVAGGIDDSFFKHTRVVFSVLYVLAISFMCLHCGRLFFAKTQRVFYCASLVLAVIGISMFFDVFRHALWLMAIEIPILFILVVVFLLSPRYRFLSGCLLAYVFLLKIYPVFMLVYFLIVRNFMAILGLVFGSCVLVGLSVFFLGYDDVAYYFFNILPVLAHEPVVQHIQNVSFLSVISATGSSFFAYVFRSLIFVAAITLVVRRWEKIYLPLVFCFVMLSMLLAISNYWAQYFVFCALPLCVLSMYCCAFYWRWIGILCLVSACVLFLNKENVFDVMPYLLGYPSLSAMMLEPHIAQDIDRAGVGLFLLDRNYVAFLLYAGLNVKVVVPFVLWCCILVTIWKESCWYFDFKSPDLIELRLPR